MKSKLVLAGLAILLAATATRGAPVQLALTPDLALFNRSEQINGVSIGVWSENPQNALALGIVNGSTGNSAGFSLALVLNYAENYKGVQWALINQVRSDMVGWQSGFINYTGGYLQGVQTGLLNYAGRLRGLQFGLINLADASSSGLQIGLINVINQNKRWFSGLPHELAPAMVFVNWSF
ncbi:MAG: hypothetical protein R6X19_11585 [Kiritimatiellia bacterium]